jgi:hypothetical protein
MQRILYDKLIGINHCPYKVKTETIAVSALTSTPVTCHFAASCLISVSLPAPQFLHLPGLQRPS